MAATAEATERATALAEDKHPGGNSGEDEPFLQRWSRRKADAAKPAVDDADPDTADADVQTASLGNAPLTRTGDKGADGEEATEIDLSALPDLDSLGADSDFSVFMQNGIPEELQKRALQKLWQLDPSFGHIDGLLEYGEDFTGTGLATEVVNTIYRVGKGMRTDDEIEAAAAAGTEAEAETETATDTDVAATSPEPAEDEPAEPAEQPDEAAPDPDDDTTAEHQTAEKRNVPA